MQQLVLSLLNKNLNKTHHHHHKGDRAFIYQMLEFPTPPSAPEGNTEPPSTCCWPIALQALPGSMADAIRMLQPFISVLSLPMAFLSSFFSLCFSVSPLSGSLGVVPACPSRHLPPRPNPNSNPGFAHAFALRALRNLSGGTQAEEEVGRNCFLSRPLSLARPFICITQSVCKQASWHRPNREIRAVFVIVTLNRPGLEMFSGKLSGSPGGGGVLDGHCL